MFFLFLILIIGPGIAGKYIESTLYDTLGGSSAFYLMQPFGLDNNDTSGKITGTAVNGNGGAAASGGASGGGGGGGGGGAASSFTGFGSSLAASPSKRAVFAYDMYH
jgi:hypothetical protein